MGGCLPMLIQMPLLFGLFIVFRTTIELRGEGFMLWITDLSAPDTIYTFPGNFSLLMYGNTVNILPLLMGVTMFIQQKMTVTDPKQKMMVYFMPIFMTLLFNSFPSGLNLYYTLFNALSILQQKYLTPKKVQPATEAPVVKKRKR
jgi:YidC/Oxa1 family membrane protein insertase